MEKNNKGTKPVVKPVTKQTVEENKAFLLANLTATSALEDFNKVEDKTAFIFRGQVFASTQAVNVTYTREIAKNDVACTQTVSNCSISYKADSLKSYTYKDFKVIELKQGQKSIMYAFKGDKLVFANISKHVLLHELALKYSITFNKVNSALAVLAGRKDGVSKANKEVISVTSTDY